LFHSADSGAEFFSWGFGVGERVSGDEYMGSYEVSIQLPAGLVSGDYHYQLEVTGGGGESSRWGRPDPGLGLEDAVYFPDPLPDRSNEVLTLISDVLPSEDDTAPEALTEVEINGGEALVLPEGDEAKLFQYPITARAMDEGSGIRNFSLTYTREDGEFLTFNFQDEDLKVGTKFEGVYEDMFGLPQYIGSSEYELSSFVVKDYAGNRYKGEAEDAPESEQRTIVIENIGSDEVAPELLGPITIEPHAVDVTEGPYEVTFTLTLKDEIAGVQDATITAFHSTDPYAIPIIARNSTAALFDSSTLISGDELHGTYEVVMEIPAGQMPGDYIYQIEARDHGFNSAMWGYPRPPAETGDEPFEPFPPPEG
jgi:hypothetical protein